jgi:cytochrome bd-type quinol oxidase subunit 2
MPSLKGLRWGLMSLACAIAWILSAWLWTTVQEHVNSTTVQLEKTFAILLAILPTIGLVGFVAERRSNKKGERLLFWLSTGMLTLLVLIGGPFRWFYAPTTVLMWTALALTRLEEYRQARAA